MAKRRKSKLAKSLLRIGKSIAKQGRTIAKQGRYLVRNGVSSTVHNQLVKFGVFNNASQTKAANLGSIAPPSSGLINFGPSVQAKPYGQITQNLGKRILSLGTQLPPDIVAAAQQAASGTGTMPEGQMLSQLRGALGIEHSGATAVNRFSNSIRGAVQGASRVGVLLNTAQQGGVAGASAQSRLFMGAIDKVDDLTKNENVVQIATKIGEAIAGDSLAGSRFLYALSRGLKLGSAVGAIALAAWDVGASYISNQKRAAAAQGSSFDAARAAGILATPELAASERSRTDHDAAMSAGMTDRVMDAFGFSGAIEERKAKAAKDNFDAIAGARSNAARSGVDTNALLIDAARKKGKSVSQLNEREKAEALNKAASNTLRDRADSDAAKRYAKAQMLLHDETPGVFGEVATGLAHLLGGHSVAELQARARERQYRNEFAAKSVNGREESLAVDRNETFQKFRAAWTAEQNQKLDRELRDSQFRLAEQRSRHRVNWFD